MVPEYQTGKMQMLSIKRSCLVFSRSFYLGSQVLVRQKGFIHAFSNKSSWFNCTGNEFIVF